MGPKSSWKGKWRKSFAKEGVDVKSNTATSEVRVVERIQTEQTWDINIVWPLQWKESEIIAGEDKTEPKESCWKRWGG